MKSTRVPEPVAGVEECLFSGPWAELARKSERVRFRRALTLLAMTLVLPGSAQMMRGNKAVGRAAMRVHGLVVVSLVVGWFTLGRGGVIKLALDPVALAAAEATILILGICWVALFLDAWRLGRPPTLLHMHRGLASVLTLALAAGVAVPSAYGARMIAAQRGIVTDVIVPGPAAKITEGRLNVLLLGGDGGYDRQGIRTDSINLASVDVATGRTVLFSLPRNLQYAQFPPGTPMAKRYPNGFPEFFFGIYTFGSEHPEMFPGARNPGAMAVMQAVAQTLGVTVHNYALVNLEGFRSVINALGGITLNVEKRIPIGGGVNLSGVEQPITGWIEPGLQKLNGYKALWYARSRHGELNGDYARMARQRCVFGALLRQADPKNVLFNFNELAKSVNHVLNTDITTGTLELLVGVAGKAKKEAVTSVQFTNALINSADPDIVFIRGEVAKAIAKSKAAPAAKPAVKTAKPATGKAKPKATPKPTAKPGDPVDINDTCKYS
jgi:LCP family protein required for cell wall assembly